MGVLRQWWRGGPAIAELAGMHLLLLPPDVPQQEVSAAARCRHPDAVAQGRVLVLCDEGPRGGRVLLHAALDLTPREAAAVGVPRPWRRVVALSAPVQREPSPPAEPDRDGLHLAFPRGLPTGIELDGLRLLLGLARRFGGAVRVPGADEILHPEPLAAVDHLVRTTTWLEPEELLDALGGLLPDAEAARSGDLEELVDGGPVPGGLFPDDAPELLDGDVDLDEDGGPVPEPYVVSAALNGVDLLLLVHPEEEIEAPAPQPSATTTTYEVRWDSAEAEAPVGGAGDRRRAERVRAQAVVARVSAAVLDRTGGIILDEDLLPVVAAGPPPQRGG